MQQTPVRAETEDLEAAATVQLIGNRGGRITIGVEAIDENGAAITPDAGTVAITIDTGVLSDFTPLGGAGEVSLVSPEPIVSAGNIRRVRATPSDLAGTGVVGIRMKVWEHD